MRPMEPHSEVGNLGKCSVTEGNDSAVRRARIAAKARANPKERFTNLLHHLTPELVTESLAKTPLNSAVGVDGMTVAQARENLDWILPTIMKQIHAGRYEAPPVRRVHIPKSDGRKRPIGVPQVIDRAIQRATAVILNEIYEQDFLPCSFGFRPSLGCHHALATIGELVHNRRMNFVLEVDIRDFFGSLDHGWLRRFLALRIVDERLLKLIDSWLKAGVVENGEWHTAETGTSQGGSVSPCLANVYLHYVLDLWFEKKIRKQLRGKAHLVRYCDDFVILFENQADLETVKILLPTRLAQFGLTIADEKTHTTDLRRNPQGSGPRRRRITFLGFDIFRSKCRSGKGHKVTFKTEGKRFTRAKQRMKENLQRIMHWPVENQAKRINSILVGHYNYYGVAGNSRRLGSFHYETVLQWRRCLSRRSQKGKLNWTEMQSMLTKFRIVGPRLKIPYGKLNAYVRL